MRLGASFLSDLHLRAPLEPNYHHNISNMLPKSIQNQSKIDLISMMHACLCLTSLFNELLITFRSKRPMLRSLKTSENHCFSMGFKLGSIGLVDKNVTNHSLKVKLNKDMYV